MVRLDQNRAQTQLAKKAGVDLTAVKDIFIYGNHSPTMFPAFAHATINGKPASGHQRRGLAAGPVLRDRRQTRRRHHRRPRRLLRRLGRQRPRRSRPQPRHPRRHPLVAVKSNGLYGFDANVWAGMPVRTTTPGSYEVITGYEMDDFAKSKIAATNKELVEERAFVADMINPTDN
jgi:malate dehydrogenase